MAKAANKINSLGWENNDKNWKPIVCSADDYLKVFGHTKVW